MKLTKFNQIITVWNVFVKHIRYTKQKYNKNIIFLRKLQMLKIKGQNDS